METKYKVIGGSATGIGTIIIAALLLMGGDYEVTENTVFCAFDDTFIEADYGISGGKHTRAYDTLEAKENWRTAPYCPTGWVGVLDEIEVVEDEEVDIVDTPKKVTCNKESCVEI